MPANALDVELAAAGDTAREAKLSGPSRWMGILEGLRV
jgi:hypothetical protein